MLKHFDKLTHGEMQILVKAPILFSVLASCGDHEISEKEKADATRLSHLKTFTADPLLLAYYEEVEKNFKPYFEAALRKYSNFDTAQVEALKSEINTIDKVIAKLDKTFAKVLHKSLSKYAEHVRKSDQSALLKFIFPAPIPGLTD